MDVLDEMGVAVKFVHSNEVKAIARAKIKTDKRDSEVKEFPFWLRRPASTCTNLANRERNRAHGASPLMRRSFGL